MRRNPPANDVMTKARARRHGTAVAAIALGSALARPSAAASWVWTGGASDANWSSGQNWTPAGVPASDGTADVTMAGTAKAAPQVDLPWPVGSLSFAAGAGSFTLSGGPLTIGPGGIENQSPSVQTFDTPVVLGADQTWNTGNQRSAGLLLNGTVDTDGHALTVTGSGAAFYGAITGAGSLVVDAPAATTVLLRGANTYSGGTVIKQGTLYIETPDRLGAADSPVTFNGGQLNVASPMALSHPITLASGVATVNLVGFAQAKVLTLSGDIQGPGALKVHGTGDMYLSLTGHNSYTGGTTVDEAILRGNSDSLTGDIALVDQYAGVEFQQYANGVYAGNISGGAGGIRKTGSGTLGLTGNISAASGLSLYGGTVELYNGGDNISATTPIYFMLTLGNGAVLQYVGGATVTRSNIGWGGEGGFAARDGKLTVNLGGSGATIDFNPMDIGPGAHMVFGSPTANSVTEFQNPLYLGRDQSSPAPSIKVNAGTGVDCAVLSGLISGGNWLAKLGDGLLRLTAANTFTGGLVLVGGATQAVDGVGLPAASQLQLAGGVLLGGGPGAASFTRPLGAGAGQVNWTTAGGGFAAAGGSFVVNIGGAGATQTWGAARFVPAGAPLMLGSAYADAETIFVNPIDLGSAQREVRVDAGQGGDSATLLGPLTGTGGGLKKSGAGSLRLVGNNTYTGLTLVTGGTLIADSDSALGATTGGTLVISPSNTGPATVRFRTGHPAIGGLASTGPGISGVILGNVAGGASATTLTVGGNNASTTFAGSISDLAGTDPSAVGNLVKTGSGTLVLDGTNTYTGSTVAGGGEIVLWPGAWGPVLTTGGGGVMAGGRLAFGYARTGSPQAAVVSLLRAGYVNGFVSSRLREASPDAYHGIGWVDDGAASRLTLLGTGYGDANLNGRIDPDDFAMIDRAVAAGLSAGWVNGDFNYDGSIDGADYLLLDTSAVVGGMMALTPTFLAAREAQFGSGYVASLVAAVPEPSLLGSCILAGLISARRRWR